MTLWAVVPAKSLATAKGRLGSLLVPDERRALATALLADVLAALRATTSVERVLVVSADDAVLALAETLGATPLREPALTPWPPPPQGERGETTEAPLP